MKDKAKLLINNTENWIYHFKHKKLALRILQNIEAARGKTDDRIIKLSDEYAADNLGWKGYAPWLYVYSAINQVFKEGWIPDNYYGEVVVPRMKGSYGTIADYNSLTSRLFDSSLFPICAYYVNGLWISPEYQILTNKEVSEIAASQPDRLVYKTDSSRQGRGIYFTDNNNFKVDELKILGNGVLQRFIHQHQFFKEIIPSSVATIRITSVIDDEGTVSARACYLRVGRTADTHVKSASHTRIPVDTSTGLLGKYGYTTDWLQIETHPDTKFVFENKQVPCFDKCLEAAMSLHKMIPFARTVGWDMIVGADNTVQVMEWNGGHNDIKFSEATQGPCFADLGWEKLWKN